MLLWWRHQIAIPGDRTYVQLILQSSPSYLDGEDFFIQKVDGLAGKINFII